MRALDLLDVLNFDNKRRGIQVCLLFKISLKEHLDSMNSTWSGTDHNQPRSGESIINGRTAFYQTVKSCAIL